MNDADFEGLIEASWRRPLTPEEETRLQALLALHPQRQADWEAESHLNQALDQLPAAPVPSNFTALVLQAARREATVPAHPSPAWWQRLGHWLYPRPAAGVAWAILLVSTTLLIRHQIHQQSRENDAQDLATISCAALLPEPQALAADFEVLRRLPESQDDELLAVLHDTANP